MVPSPNNAEDDPAKVPKGTSGEKSLGMFRTPAWIGSSEPAFGLLGFLLLMPFATVIGAQTMPTKFLLGRFAINLGILFFWSSWLYRILRNAGPGPLERILKALNGWILVGYLWMWFVGVGTFAAAAELLNRWHKP